MLDALVDYLRALFFSYLGVAGTISTLIWISQLFPKVDAWFRSWVNRKLWKFGPPVLASLMFVCASFEVYHQETKRLKTEIVQLKSSKAEGYLVVSIRTQKFKDSAYVFLDLENASTAGVLGYSLEDVGLSLDEITIPSRVGGQRNLIAPSRVRSYAFQWMMKGTNGDWSHKPRKLKVSLRGSYGFVGSNSDVRLCEVLSCDFLTGASDGDIKSLACNRTACQ